MLRLTPFRETLSYRETFQEDIHAQFVDKLAKHVKRKFRLADRTTAKLRLRLEKLALPDLELLFEEVVDMNLLRELNAWIDDRLAPPVPSQEMPLAA